jgi:hypothetical protein
LLDRSRPLNASTSKPAVVRFSWGRCVRLAHASAKRFRYLRIHFVFGSLRALLSVCKTG